MFHPGTLASDSSNNAGLQQRPPDGFGINTKLLSDLNQGLAGPVALDHPAQLGLVDLLLSTGDPGPA